jgi:DNA-binding MarR family transcriptional regulator
MSKQGAAKLLQTLVDEDYVEVGSASGDARRKPVVLTRRGRAAVEASVAIQHDIEQRWAAVVGPQEMQTLRATLRQAVLAESDGTLPPVRPAW